MLKKNGGWLTPDRLPHTKEVGEGSYKREPRLVNVNNYSVAHLFSQDIARQLG